VLFILERGPTPVRGRDRRFGFGQVDGGDLVGGQEDAIASVAAHGPYGDAFAPDAFSRLIPGRLPWRPHAICFHAAKSLDVRFFRFRTTEPPHSEAKGGRDE
jgi:hypothetical protein